MDTNSAEPNETATFSVMSNAVEHAGTMPPKTGGQTRRYLAVAWSFTRHLLEMVVAMVAGMAVLGVALAVLGAAFGGGSRRSTIPKNRLDSAYGALWRLTVGSGTDLKIMVSQVRIRVPPLEKALQKCRKYIALVWLPGPFVSGASTAR